MNQVAFRRTEIGVSAVTVGAYAWWATGLRPFTLPSLTAVLAAGGLAAVLGALFIPRDVRPMRLRSHRELWIGLVAAVGVWELASFAQHPRSEHPTLSSLTNTVFASHLARALGLLVWLALGAWLARQTIPARPLAGRVLLMTAFLWLGWHVFVRASY
ncbi:MAG: hypothetical protein LC792_01565 [Actinobacteria bacterium]|nr:hypothetical protein [Actinomycetota bacterium]